MNREEIKRLLEKYYNGNSTDEEERVLKEFFSRETVPDEFQHDRAIFGYFHQASEVPEASADFEERIISALENDSFTLRPQTRNIILTVAGIAAGIAILAGTWFFLRYYNEPHDTFSDPAIAYAETMKILYGVSYQLNNVAKSLEPVTKLSKETARSLEALDSPARILNENLKSLDKFNQTVSKLDLINNENKINKN